MASTLSYMYQPTDPKSDCGHAFMICLTLRVCGGWGRECAHCRELIHILCAGLKSKQLREERLSSWSLYSDLLGCA